MPEGACILAWGRPSVNGAFEILTYMMVKGVTKDRASARFGAIVREHGRQHNTSPNMPHIG